MPDPTPPAPPPRLDIAIGLVLHHGKLLLCKRRPDTHLGGFWEFPGGKVEPPESPTDCLLRELQEEVGLAVAPLHAFTPIDHTYPTRSVRLHPFLCKVLSGQPQPLASVALAWVSPEDLPHYPLPPANAPLLAELQHFLQTPPEHQR